MPFSFVVILRLIRYTRDLISPSCVLEVRRQERRKQASNEPVDQDEDSEDEYDYEIFSKRVS